jgi:hypothetical protein
MLCARYTPPGLFDLVLTLSPPQAAGQPERFLCITCCVMLPCLTRDDVPRPDPLPSRSWPVPAGRLRGG